MAAKSNSVRSLSGKNRPFNSGETKQTGQGTHLGPTEQRSNPRAVCPYWPIDKDSPTGFGYSRLYVPHVHTYKIYILHINTHTHPYIIYIYIYDYIDMYIHTCVYNISLVVRTNPKVYQLGVDRSHFSTETAAKAMSAPLLMSGKRRSERKLLESSSESS